MDETAPGLLNHRGYYRRVGMHVHREVGWDGDAAAEYDQNDVVGPLPLTDTLRDVSQVMGLSMWFGLTVVRAKLPGGSVWTSSGLRV